MYSFLRKVRFLAMAKQGLPCFAHLAYENVEKCTSVCHCILLVRAIERSIIIHSMYLYLCRHTIVGIQSYLNA